MSFATTIRRVLAVLVFASIGFGQSAPADRGVELAMAGHCQEAMPLLDGSMRGQDTTTATRRTVAFAGVRCSMILNQQNDAMSFLSWLQQAFPQDPDVLFLAVHVFSELSDRNAQTLLKTAPDSTLVIQLNAERFEQQNRIPEAIAEYRILLKRAPTSPGIHYRIGGLLMSQPGAGPAVTEEARKEFEQELQINPQNPGAEFYLGEIARQANNLPAAIDHYRRALKLYPGFADASFGLGRCLLDSEKPQDAIAPLETAAKGEPDNPTIHLALATAYQRCGRKDDATREFALQKETAHKLNANAKALKKNVSGMPVDTPANP